MAAKRTVSGLLRRAHDARGKALVGYVRIEDVTMADAAARVLATTPVTLEAAAESAAFTIEVDEWVDDASREYAWTAELRAPDQEAFGTTARYCWTPADEQAPVVIRIAKW